MNRHFRIRPFKCSLCDQSSYTSADRNAHETYVHEKLADRHKCDKCPFQTHSVYFFNIHDAKVHGLKRFRSDKTNKINTV